MVKYKISDGNVLELQKESNVKRAILFLSCLLYRDNYILSEVFREVKWRNKGFIIENILSRNDDFFILIFSTKLCL